MNRALVLTRNVAATLVASSLLLSNVFGEDLASAAPNDATFDSASTQHASETLEAVYAAAGVPALAAAIAVDGEIVWERYLGFSNLESGSTVGVENTFRIGSVSKAVTAVALARVWQDGLIELDTDVRRYVPDFPDKGVMVTPRQLSGHLGGIRNYQNTDYTEPFNIDRRNFSTTNEALEIFINDPLISKPGEEYHYSVYGYTLLAATLERAARRDFLSILQDKIIEPLGLDYTGADFGNVPGSVTGYERTAEGGASVAGPKNLSYKWAGGGLRSNVRDMAMLGSAILNTDFLTPESLELLTKSQATASGEDTDVAVGWRVGEDSRNRRFIHHAGSISGGRAVILVYPDDGVTVSITSNQALAPLMIESTAQVLAEPFLLKKRGKHFDRVRQTGEFEFAWTARGATHAGYLTYDVENRDDRVELHPALNAWSARLGSPISDSAEILPMLVSGTKALIPVVTAAGAFNIDVTIGADDALIGQVTGQYVRVEGDFRAQRTDAASH